MNNKGQSGIGTLEGVIIIVLILITAASLYMLFKKDSSIYQSGSNPDISDIHRQDWPFSIHIGEGGCQRIPKTELLKK